MSLLLDFEEAFGVADPEAVADPGAVGEGVEFEVGQGEDVVGVLEPLGEDRGEGSAARLVSVASATRPSAQPGLTPPSGSVDGAGASSAGASSSPPSASSSPSSPSFSFSSLSFSPSSYSYSSSLPEEGDVAAGGGVTAGVGGEFGEAWRAFRRPGIRLRSPLPCSSARSDPRSGRRSRSFRGWSGGRPRPRSSIPACSRRTRRRIHPPRCRSCRPLRSSRYRCSRSRCRG